MLIHQDAHLGNLFITDDGQISLFDFDDCGYGTRTHDVAIVLFYWLMSREDQQDEVRRFVPLFLSGYERHATLPARWPEGADLILSNREIEIYWLIKTDSEAPNPMEAPFMVDRRQRLLDGVPYLGIPLAELL